MSCGVGANRFKESILGDLKVIGELFRGEVSCHGLSECVALRCEQCDGMHVVFGEGA